MQEKQTFIQFLSPWQGRLGFRRFDYQPDGGGLEPSKTVRCDKMIRKAARNVDGLLLRPIWPTRRGLCLVKVGEAVLLKPVSGRQVRTDQSIAIDDPAFEMDVSERLLYRRFCFRNDRVTLVYRDMAGRLFGPQRMATDIFPDEDFSPFARLIGMLRDDTCRTRFLSDLARRRFKYSRWIDTGGWLRRPALAESKADCQKLA